MKSFFTNEVSSDLEYVLVNIASSGNQYQPTITQNSNGSLTICWTGVSSSIYIVVCRFCENKVTNSTRNQLCGSEIQISDSNYYIYYPNLNFLPSGNILILNSKTVDSYYQIYGSILQLNGSKTTENQKINSETYSQNNQMYPSSLTLYDNKIVTIWSNVNQYYNYGVVYQDSCTVNNCWFSNSTDPSTCDTCNEFQYYFLNEKKSCFLCTNTSGYYLSSSKRPFTCSQCSSSNCITCPNNICSQCKSGYYLYADLACFSQCEGIYGQYSLTLDNILKCMNCSQSNCKTCSSNICSQCNSGYYLYADATCSSQCNTAAGYYIYTNNGIDKCLACSTSGCQICANNTCSQCNSGYYLYEDSSCHNSCNFDSYYSVTIDGVFLCKNCTQTNCKTCPSNICSACMANYYLLTNNACASTCDTTSSYYSITIDQIIYCKGCIATNCQACDSNICSQCLSPYFLYDNFTCQIQCEVEGHYQPSNSKILQCKTCSQNYCKICPEDICQECISTSYQFDSLTCSMTCDTTNGYYELIQDLKKYCKVCNESQCKSCPSNICTECNSDYYLSLIHISEPTRLGMISYAVFCLKKKKKKKKTTNKKYKQTKQQQCRTYTQQDQ
eukprot:TRINITY_DN4304_c0_g1_i3.p1 TRINITY_DN4304_c0_g1~~TRINITY_DN4304_c0_g1_i3.p1  ORF type:complete len:613 (+),score=88.94 TRINITY_DN4304_c0_g1_i3:816-2654(+)